MLTKEDYLEYLDEEAEIFGEGYRAIRKLIEEHFDPKPYAFEDLKETLWVFDTYWLTLRQIRYIVEEKEEIQFYDTDYREKFEENRFYLPSKANQGK